jgi:hypothetical protein
MLQAVGPAFEAGLGVAWITTFFFLIDRHSEVLIFFKVYAIGQKALPALPSPGWDETT